MIDKSLYASIDASRSLINSGVTLTTKMIWDVDTSALVPAGNPTTRSYTPAPDLGEIWKELPIAMTLIKRETGNAVFFKTRVGAYDSINESAVDALIYALIWYRRETNHKRKAEIMVKRLIDSYCCVEESPDSNTESSIYLGVRREVIDLLEKALKESGI